MVKKNKLSLEDKVFYDIVPPITFGMLGTVAGPVGAFIGVGVGRKLGQTAKKYYLQRKQKKKKK